MGCGSEETPAPPVVPACEPPGFVVPSGICVVPGVPADGCGVGFAHDNLGGCVAVLPSEPCPSGMIALPGDETCREVSPCGQGTWGDIPVDGASEYVDGSYAAADSDGSAERPWPTISQAVDAAAAGALVAVAPGSYGEDLELNKPIILWGKCPAEVDPLDHRNSCQHGSHRLGDRAG